MDLHTRRESWTVNRGPWTVKDRTDHGPRSSTRFLLVFVLLLSPCLLVGYARADEDHRQQEEAGATARNETEEQSALGEVLDSDEWHLFESFWPHSIPLWPFTRFMILEVIAALIVLGIYVPVAKRLHSGDPPRGTWDNCFESVLTFLRNEVARPTIGEKEADKYVPFLWTLFLFILANNLLGLVPFGGSPTSSIWMTLGLAICVFFAIHGCAIAKMGVKHYAESMWPPLDVPFPFNVLIPPMVCFLEVMGVLVRNVVLAVRLFANMFAGHMVVATILLFIYMAREAHTAVWTTVTVSTVVGLVLLSLLEIFVAFLQAFIFVFLTSLFMGLALNPEH
jgi:F-type H+-transporting ATPase subunit a